MHSALHLLSDPYRTIFRLPSLTFDEQLDMAVYYAECRLHEHVELNAIAAEEYFRGRDELREWLRMVKECGVVMYNSAGEPRYKIINP